MTSYTFTPHSISYEGKTYPAGYSVTPSGYVFVFVTIKDGADPIRVKFIPLEPDYPAALEAARAARSTTPAAAPGDHAPHDEKAAPDGQNDKKAPVKAPALEIKDNNIDKVKDSIKDKASKATTTKKTVKATKKPIKVEPKTSDAPDIKATKKASTSDQAPAVTIKEKDFIGKTIAGNGWQILFDGVIRKTRVVFDGVPIADALQAVQNAGFYYSKIYNSYNKNITFKAYRAALALAVQLKAIYA